MFTHQHTLQDFLHIFNIYLGFFLHSDGLRAAHSSHREWRFSHIGGALVGTTGPVPPDKQTKTNTIMLKLALIYQLVFRPPPPDENVYKTSVIFSNHLKLCPCNH